MIVLSSATSPVLSISAARTGPRSDRKPTAEGLPGPAAAGWSGLAAVLVTVGVDLSTSSWKTLPDLTRRPPPHSYAGTNDRGVVDHPRHGRWARRSRTALPSGS